jgi:hypothetical protein
LFARECHRKAEALKQRDFHFRLVACRGEVAGACRTRPLAVDQAGTANP